MILFGTAGVPDSAGPGGTVRGIARIRELGLDCMEVQFVRGVSMGEAKAAEVKVAAELHGVALSCHAPYYINFASPEAKVRRESAGRLLAAAEAGWLCGATDVVFHAGFYLEADSEKVFTTIRKEIVSVQKSMAKRGVAGMTLRPELMGKPTQFGSPDELLRMSADLENVLPCVDFSHFIARDAGHSNCSEAFTDLLDSIDSRLGRRGLDNMHIHLSGIEYGDRGEKKHLPANESVIKWRDVLKALAAAGAGGRIICESPDMSKELDSAMFKKHFQKLAAGKGSLKKKQKGKTNEK